MCNLYWLTKGQQAIREFVKATRDCTGNMPSLPGIFSDMEAPIVRTGDNGNRELAMASWGMPTPSKFLEGNEGDSGVTNIRNTKARTGGAGSGQSIAAWYPFKSFREYDTSTGRRCRYGLPPMEAGGLGRGNGASAAAGD